MRFSFIVIALAALFVSCQKNQTVTKNYFDIDSLIDNQLIYLRETNASLTKTASIDKDQDEATFKPDSAGWANELEAFRHLDIINKSIYVDAYEITDGKKDENSNLIVRNFQATREIPIEYFRIYYQDSPKRIRKIEASLSEQNTLYFTARTFSIDRKSVV